MGWGSYNEDNESRHHNATIVRKKEHDALMPASTHPAKATQAATKLKSFAAPQPRPLPVIVLADVSGSMTEGNKIELLNVALREMVSSFAKESRLRAEIQVGLITFGGRAAAEHLPLVAAHEVSAMKPLAASGPTPMGKAFDLACRLLEDKERIRDDYRIAYLKSHITACQQAISDGVVLLGYCAWSFTDLLSWLNGYQKRYGFVYVDRDEQDAKALRRIRKDSFYWYQTVIASHGAEP